MLHSLYSMIIRKANMIAINTRRGAGNFEIGSPGVVMDYKYLREKLAETLEALQKHKDVLIQQKEKAEGDKKSKLQDQIDDVNSNIDKVREKIKNARQNKTNESSTILDRIDKYIN